MIRPRQNSRPWLRVQMMRTPTPGQAHAAGARAVTKMRTIVRAGGEVVRETAMTTVVAAAAVTRMSTTARMTRVRIRIKAMTVAATTTVAAAMMMTAGATNNFL